MVWSQLDMGVGAGGLHAAYRRGGSCCGWGGMTPPAPLLSLKVAPAKRTPLRDAQRRRSASRCAPGVWIRKSKTLGVDSFSIIFIVLFKNRSPFPQGFWWFSRKKDPWK